MFARLNFLLSVSLFSVFAFYLVGRHVLLKVAVALVPVFVPWLAAAYILGALMLTVLILAQMVGRLNAVAARGSQPAPGGMFAGAQTLLVLGHIAAFSAIQARFANGDASAISWILSLLAPLLYAAGIALSVSDRKARASRATP